jgi:hypothetical protein
MKKYIFISILSIILFSCDNSIEKKMVNTNEVEASVNKMVYSTLTTILTSELSEDQLFKGDTLFKIVQNYDNSVNLSRNKIMKANSENSTNVIDTLSNEQIAIINKLDSMAAIKDFDFERIKSEIPLLPDNEKETMYLIVAVVEGGAEAIDQIKAEWDNSPSNINGKQRISSKRAQAILCGATTGGVGAIYGAWSGAIVGAIYGTTAGGFVGTVVGIASGAILGAYIC